VADAHQARGFYSQMIVGSSFNATGFPDGRWNVDPTITVTEDAAATFFDTPSEEIKLASAALPSAAGSAAAAAAGVSNRGLGNAGMVFESGKVYEGFLFARLPAAEAAAGGGGGGGGGGGAAVSMTVSLEDYSTKKTLATQTLSIAATGASQSSGDFVRYNFTLTPSASTNCVDITPGSDPDVSCGHGKPRSPIGAYRKRPFFCSTFLMRNAIICQDRLGMHTRKRWISIERWRFRRAHVRQVRRRVQDLPHHPGQRRACQLRVPAAWGVGPGAWPACAQKRR
jgi:hypothetical protein